MYRVMVEERHGGAHGLLEVPLEFPHLAVHRLTYRREVGHGREGTVQTGPECRAGSRVYFAA